MSDYADDFEEDVAVLVKESVCSNVTCAPTPTVAASEGPCEAHSSPTAVSGGELHGVSPVQMVDTHCQTEVPGELSAPERTHMVVVGGATYLVNSAQSARSSRGAVSSQSLRVGQHACRPHSVSFVSNELRKIGLIHGPQVHCDGTPLKRLRPGSPGFAMKNKGSFRPIAPGADTGCPRKLPAEQMNPMSAFEASSNSSIWNAACSGDANALTKLVTQQCLITGADSYSIVNMLGYVTLNRVRYGLKRCGLTYTVGLGGKASPLQFAAAMGHAPAVKTLLDLGARDSIGDVAALPKASHIAEANGFAALKLLFNVPPKRRVARSAIAPVVSSAATENGVDVSVVLKEDAAAPDSSWVMALPVGLARNDGTVQSFNGHHRSSDKVSQGGSPAAGATAGVVPAAGATAGVVPAAGATAGVVPPALDVSSSSSDFESDSD